MDESLYFVHTRNCEQETIYYIQEIKTIFEKFFTHTKEKQKFLIALVISTGKKTN